MNRNFQVRIHHKEVISTEPHTFISTTFFDTHATCEAHVVQTIETGEYNEIAIYLLHDVYNSGFKWQRYELMALIFPWNNQGAHSEVYQFNWCAITELFSSDRIENLLTAAFPQQEPFMGRINPPPGTGDQLTDRVAAVFGGY